MSEDVRDLVERLRASVRAEYESCDDEDKAAYMIGHMMLGDLRNEAADTLSRLLARVTYQDALLAKVEALANAPLIDGKTAHMQRLISIRMEIGTYRAPDHEETGV